MLVFGHARVLFLPVSSTVLAHDVSLSFHIASPELSWCPRLLLSHPGALARAQKWGVIAVPVNDLGVDQCCHLLPAAPVRMGRQD